MKPNKTASDCSEDIKQQWFFYQNANGLWRWRKGEHGTAEVSEPFVQYWDCVQDAKGQGYLGGAQHVAQSG